MTYITRHPKCEYKSLLYPFILPQGWYKITILKIYIYM